MDAFPRNLANRIPSDRLLHHCFVPFRRELCYSDSLVLAFRSVSFSQQSCCRREGVVSKS